MKHEEWHQKVQEALTAKRGEHGYRVVDRPDVVCLRCKQDIPIGTEVSICLGNPYHVYSCTRAKEKASEYTVLAAGVAL